MTMRRWLFIVLLHLIAAFAVLALLAAVGVISFGWAVGAWGVGFCLVIYLYLTRTQDSSEADPPNTNE